MSEQQQELYLRSMNVSYSEPPLPRASLVIWIVGIGLVIFFIWAWFLSLKKFQPVQAQVIPSSKEQVIQSLEGGILTKLNVQEGDHCPKKGKFLLSSTQPVLLQMWVSRDLLLIAAQATAARLRAEVNGYTTGFP